jgi:hypothetical protein
VADTYFRCELTEAEILRLVEADQVQEQASRRAIYRVWPDFPVHPLIDVSCATVKADAARRSFDATGRGITWAVLDSGIDADHHHFRRYETLKGDVANLHRDFTKRCEPATGEALVELALLEDDPEEVFGRFADAVPQTGEGGAAGIGDTFGRLWNGAREALRQLTYFEMKKRAGVVGKDGLGPLLSRIHQAYPDVRIHLIGHSFGPGWSPSPWPACRTRPAPR